MVVDRKAVTLLETVSKARTYHTVSTALQTVFGAAQHDMPHSTTCHIAQTSISKCTLHTCPDSVEQPAPACTYCCETPASKACHNAIVSFQQTQTLSLTEKEECIMSQIHYLQFGCAWPFQYLSLLLTILVIPPRLQSPYHSKCGLIVISTCDQVTRAEAVAFPLPPIPGPVG